MLSRIPWRPWRSCCTFHDFPGTWVAPSLNSLRTAGKNPRASTCPWVCTDLPMAELLQPNILGGKQQWQATSPALLCFFTGKKRTCRRFYSTFKIWGAVTIPVAVETDDGVLGNGNTSAGHPIEYVSPKICFFFRAYMQWIPHPAHYQGLQFGLPRYLDNPWWIRGDALSSF